MGVELEDIRWLVSTAAAPFLDAAKHADAKSAVNLVALLRKYLSAARTHLVIEQTELRRRAKEKFAAAEQMFFTPIGLMQATDEVTAAYKAGRFPAEREIVDFCCGIGGDLLALARRAKAVGVDREKITTLLAAANCLANELSTVEVIAGDVCNFPLSCEQSLHIDPDRRPSGRRTTQLELHEPSEAQVRSFMAKAGMAAIKLAPATDVPADWGAVGECEWISRGGECKQLVVWLGDGTRDFQPGARTATILPKKPLATGELPRRIIGEATRSPEDVFLAGNLGRFLYEPDAAVLAAHLTPTLASEHALGFISANVAYLTGDAIIRDPALAGFEVLEVFPFDVKKLKSAIRARRIGRLEVKKRGVELDPAKLQKQLKTAGDAAATLIVSPTPGGVIAALAQRISSSP